MRNLFFVMWAMAAFVGGVGADAASDAKAELEQKQKERERKRAEVTQISIGELDDLRSENRRLQAENTALKGKGAAPAANAKAPVKRYTTIEVGMTRDELMNFVKSRSTQYRVGAMVTEAGGVQVERTQTIEKSKQSGESQTVTDNIRSEAAGRPGATGTPIEKTKAEDMSVADNSARTSDRTIEHRREKDKRERITVEVMGYKSAVVGTERNTSGTFKKMGRVKAVRDRSSRS